MPRQAPSDLSLPIAQPITRSHLRLMPAAGLLVLAALLAGAISIDPQVGYAQSTKERKPAEPNRVPLGLKLLTEHQRLLVFQDRLRGLCEVTAAERVTPGKWRASCADGGAFIIKVYRDGFMTVTRSP